MSLNRKIVVIATGGTIAGAASSPSDHTGYLAGQLDISHLVAAIPGLADPACSLQLEQLAQLDSKDMDAVTLARLAQRVAELLDQEAVQGVVITHGTDTLEETAYFLHALLAPAKPVVVTCAMRPATALSADGPQNLLDAVTVARHPGAKGVLAVCAGAVHGPLDVYKAHPYRLDAFSSGDVGPLAWVEAGGLRVLRPWPDGQGQRQVLASLSSPWPQVAIVTSHAEATAWMVPALVAAGAQGLVVAATGNGTVHKSLEKALLEAQQEGLQVRRASRCAQGLVVEGASDALPLFAAYPGLSPVKARLALVLELMGLASVALG